MLIVFEIIWLRCLIKEPSCIRIFAKILSQFIYKYLHYVYRIRTKLIKYLIEYLSGIKNSI